MTQEIVAYNEFRGQLAELKSNNAALVFDYADPLGNKAARSHVYKLRQTKAAVDRVRKAEKEASLERGRKVDAEAKEIISEIEGMIDIHQKPLDEIEERENLRLQSIQARIEEIRNAGKSVDAEGVLLTSAELKTKLEFVTTLAVDESFSEFINEARAECVVSKDSIAKHIAAAEKREAEVAELERLRREAEERARRDRDEQIRREAEEKARKDADVRAQQEREAANRREVELQMEAERAARERDEANRRAEQAARETEERLAREAEERRQAEARETEKREKDKKHRASINSAAVEALVKGGMKSEPAKLAITLIAKGSIPRVSVSY